MWRKKLEWGDVIACVEETSVRQYFSQHSHKPHATSMLVNYKVVLINICTYKLVFSAAVGSQRNGWQTLTNMDNGHNALAIWVTKHLPRWMTAVLRLTVAKTFTGKDNRNNRTSLTIIPSRTTKRWQSKALIAPSKMTVRTEDNQSHAITL